MSEAKPLNPSLQKKSAARLAAVQSLYTQSVTGAKPADRQVAEWKKQLAHNAEEQKLRSGVAMEPNYTLMETILAGVAQWRSEIDTRLDGALTEGWARNRQSPVLIAILQCAIFELFFHKDAPSRMLIDEYTRIARSFFAEGETNFVHAALGKLVQQYGPL